MDPKNIDISVVARDLKLAPQNVEAAVKLLDEGNTIPFVTRFRKDLTGGLNEEQLLAVKNRTAQLRALGERKASILRTIEAQGELTDQLREQIDKTHSSRRLEEIYSPFKTKKQSRASMARQQGLAPLADEILDPNSGIDFATRATDFVRVDKGLNSVEDVIKGVSDLLAEKFAENEDLRSKLRKLVRETGKLTSVLISQTPTTSDTPETPAEQKNDPPESAAKAEEKNPATEPGQKPATEPVESTDATAKTTPAEEPQNVSEAPESEPSAESETGAEQVGVSDASTSSDDVPASENESQPDESLSATEESQPAEATEIEKSVEAIASGDVTAQPQPVAKTKSKSKKKKKKEQDPFQDYHDFSSPINKLPHHRVLAINRGERAGKLRVKIKVDSQQVSDLAKNSLVPEDHPSSTFLCKCASETVNRSLLPSIEREIRRELTENAERHAVEVFANNLKNLLLQPPVRNRVILAIDPGYKRGCSVAVVDSCGNLLDSGQVFVVGNKQRRDESKLKIRDWVKNLKVEVIAIGNGSGCRQVEQMVSDSISELLSDSDVRYIIINEAGTSIYSTSEIGREELPDVPPATRSAVSIARRLIDPLSEFVKIAPANIGVGLYQHDIKAKHLGESLDEVVQSCVNRVGVDVNTASSALLRYVSGLNALTARRVIEYRRENGRFNTREELKNVNGVGQTTFVQAAGFLRVHGGSNPLDATGIHPECYSIAEDILNRITANVDQIFPRWMMQPAKQELARREIEQKQQKRQDQKESVAEDAATGSQSGTTVPKNAPDRVASPPENATCATKIDSVFSPPVDDSLKTNGDSLESAPIESAPVETAPIESTTLQDDAAAQTVVAPGETESLVEATPSQESASDPTAQHDASTEGSSTPLEESPQKEPEGNGGPRINRREFEQKRKELVKKLNELNVDDIATTHKSGKLLVNDVIMSLKRPAWDPRDKFQKPLFRRGILNISDLKPEMQLEGQVINVVDFGVFVDIGLGESSLVHVSQLSTFYISDPFKHFSVGDVIKVWVTEVDAGSRRIKLTAVKPGTKKPGKRPRKDRKVQSRQSGKSDTGSRNDKDSSTRSQRKPGKYDSKRQFSKKSQPRRHQKRSQPKEIRPITEKMLRGDEPMRSFSDLAQFVRQKPEKDKTKAGAKNESQSRDQESGENS